MCECDCCEEYETVWVSDIRVYGSEFLQHTIREVELIEEDCENEPCKFKVRHKNGTEQWVDQIFENQAEVMKYMIECCTDTLIGFIEEK